ncbi:hypothetical protein Tco_0067363 [Tanacetum coccineum]
MGSASPPNSSDTHVQRLPYTTRSELTLRIKKLLKIRRKFDSLLFETIKDLPNKTPSDEPFGAPDKVEERELRAKRKIDFEEEMFKDTFPTDEEISYHKRLLEGPHPPFSTLDPKIKRGDPWSLKSHDLGSVIDGRLNEVVLGKPFVQVSKLAYDESLGLIRSTLEPSARSLEHSAWSLELSARSLDQSSQLNNLSLGG